MSPQTESGEPSSVDTRTPAVVYFAKAPIAGLVKTRLCPPLTTDEAAALYGAFLRQVVRKVPGARTLVYGWPGEHLDHLAASLPEKFWEEGIELRPQNGADLWERMQNCFAELFREGHGVIVLRNTDSPDLPTERVREAVAAAEPGAVVLGPDTGGGYYLVALGAPCPGLFEDLDEGAPTVFEATVRRAEDLGLRVRTLAEHPDVDTFEDLLALWRRRS